MGREPGSREQLGRRVRQLRDEAGLSREALADRAGISARGIEDIENGADPKLTTALRLARSLGVTLDELVAQGDQAERLRLIRLLADPGETPDDVTVAMMKYLRKVMAEDPGTDRQ